MVQLLDLLCEVIDVKGRCDASLKKGDRIILRKDFTIDLEKSDRVCYWALSDLMPCLFALHLGHDPREIGMSDEKGVAYLQCSDPGPPITPGGNVLFKISRLE